MPKQLRTDRRNTPYRMPPVSLSTNLKRRGFLLALGVGGVGAAAVAARSMTGAAIDVEPAVTTPAGGKGYAETEHVRRYYRTMKV